MNTGKEQRAIEYLKMFEPEEYPYHLCYSGGKDSDCIRILAQLAGVRHEIHHNLTTVDAPETVQYIKSIPNVMIDYPKISMWMLIVKKMMPPTRVVRYCCLDGSNRFCRKALPSYTWSRRNPHGKTVCRASGI